MSENVSRTRLDAPQGTGLNATPQIAYRGVGMDMPLNDEALVRLDDVEIVRRGGLALYCRVRGRETCIPYAHIVEGDAGERGDHGHLVIPLWLAEALALR